MTLSPITSRRILSPQQNSVACVSTYNMFSFDLPTSYTFFFPRSLQNGKHTWNTANERERKRKMQLLNIVWMLLLLAIFSSSAEMMEEGLSTKQQILNALSSGIKVNSKGASTLRNGQSQQLGCGSRQIAGCVSQCGCYWELWGTCMGYNCCCYPCSADGTHIGDACGPSCPCVSDMMESYNLGCGLDLECGAQAQGWKCLLFIYNWKRSYI